MDRHNICGRSAKHFLGILPDFENLAAELVHCDNGGLSRHDTLALFKKQCRGCSKINRYVSLK